MTTETKAPKTIRDHLKALAGAALIVGVILLMLEIMLMVFDPWGMRYFNDLATMGNELFISDSARGYVLADGRQGLSNWTATIQNGTRLLPANHADGTCTLTILGDSVAFAYGVHDADSWLNQLAPDFPTVNFVNTAVPRYNSTNVLRTHAVFTESDSYLYLIINNDLEDAIDPTTMIFAGDGGNLPWLVRYMNFAIYRGGGTAYVPPTDANRLVADNPQSQRFFRELDELLEDERVYLAAFELETLTNTLLARNYDVTILNYPPEYISLADYHLNPQGNRLLAHQLRPLLERIVTERCDNG